MGFDRNKRAGTMARQRRQLALVLEDQREKNKPHADEAIHRLSVLFPTAAESTLRAIVKLSPHEEAAVGRMLLLGYPMWGFNDYKLLAHATKHVQKFRKGRIGPRTAVQKQQRRQQQSHRDKTNIRFVKSKVVSRAPANQPHRPVNVTGANGNKNANNRSGNPQNARPAQSADPRNARPATASASHGRARQAAAAARSNNPRNARPATAGAGGGVQRAAAAAATTNKHPTDLLKSKPAHSAMKSRAPQPVVVHEPMRVGSSSVQPPRVSVPPQNQALRTPAPAAGGRRSASPRPTRSKVAAAPAGASSQATAAGKANGGKRWAKHAAQDRAAQQQRPREPDNRRPKEPDNSRPKEPDNSRPKEPDNRRPKEPDNRRPPAKKDAWF